MKKHLTFLALLGGATSCYGGGGGGGYFAGEANPAEQTLNHLVRTEYPSGRQAALPTATEQPGPGHLSTVLQPGQNLYVSAPTSGAEVCVAFGDPSNGWCVPVEDTFGGELSLPIPADLCEGIDISNLCHDIRCYESATLDGVTFTQTTVQPLLAACGGCDEPSCAPLIQQGICQCATAADCSSGETCDGGVCVLEGVLRFSARWDTNVDVDLHVIDPSGEELDFTNPFSASNGQLDNDDTSGGPGTVENIAWATTAPAGNYTYYVVNYSGGASGPVTLSVYSGGTLQNAQTVTLGQEPGAESTRFTFQY